MKSRIFKLLNSIVKEFETPTKLVIPSPSGSSTFLAVELALESGMISPTFVGDKTAIEGIIKEKGLKIKCDIVNEPESDKAIAKSVELVKEGKFDTLMKGGGNTDTLLHLVLDKEKGLKRESILSHVALFDVPGHDKIIILTDAGVNIQPDLGRKITITENAIRVARVLDIKAPKVAVLAAVEKVIYPAMPATRDADLLAQMSRQGKFGDAVVEGPFALDNAVSPEAAKTKGIKSEVAGKADILILPDIEAANILYKSLTCFAKAEVASIVVGAEIPLVVPSRADNEISKFLSILLASVYAERYEK